MTNSTDTPLVELAGIAAAYSVSSFGFPPREVLFNFAFRRHLPVQAL
jgi:hypothetical protein